MEMLPNTKGTNVQFTKQAHNLFSFFVSILWCSWGCACPKADLVKLGNKKYIEGKNKTMLYIILYFGYLWTMCRNLTSWDLF
jgi:hypothetical protein